MTAGLRTPLSTSYFYITSSLPVGYLQYTPSNIPILFKIIYSPACNNIPYGIRYSKLTETPLATDRRRTATDRRSSY
eukprot:scaffold158019_cov35-Attheya_sp.AAC.1